MSDLSTPGSDAKSSLLRRIRDHLLDPAGVHGKEGAAVTPCKSTLRSTVSATTCSIRLRPASAGASATTISPNTSEANPRGPNQPIQHRDAAQPRADQRNRNRKHADQRQAQHSIQDNPQAQGLDHSKREDTKDEEHTQVEQLSFRL